MVTESEGEWDEVMAVDKKATFHFAERGNRTGVIMKAYIRPGHTNMMTRKVAAVEDILKK